MKTKLYNQNAEIIGDIDLPDKVYGLVMNHDLLKQVVHAQSANSRQVLAHTKDRAQVRGGGRKPWKQKGTGRARHASIRSPIWKGGGVAFGPTKERNFAKKINKKMKRTALFMALSSKIKDKEALVLNDIRLDAPKTKLGINLIKTLSSKMEGYRATKKKMDSILLVAPDQDRLMARAFNNLNFVDMQSAKSLNVMDVLKKRYLILLKDAIGIIESTYKL